ncbi:hypothetical protein B0H16DRAFT_253677 [Mycena metata]|uniref:Uncharacterized protein n=1 Tax=Mycena metata TaxID=1033252 RepID=A0AAD7JPM1_9AGAR|nr:hypothetical protein B0H16DRAFT_253677 [Mycena metata]
MNVDDDVFGNGQPQAQQGFHFHTPPAVPPPQLPPPPPPAPAPAAGGAQLFAAAAAVFNAVAVVAAVQTPPDLALLNHAVVGREHNGYHGNQVAMETPPVNAEGRTTVQRNDGSNPNLVITVEQALHGIHRVQRDFIRDHWNDIVIIVMFLGELLLEVHQRHQRRLRRPLRVPRRRPRTHRYLQRRP